jgi:hypothetical protein
MHTYRDALIGVSRCHYPFPRHKRRILLHQRDGDKVPSQG